MVVLTAVAVAFVACGGDDGRTVGVSAGGSTTTTSEPPAKAPPVVEATTSTTGSATTSATPGPTSTRPATTTSSAPRRVPVPTTGVPPVAPTAQPPPADTTVPTTVALPALPVPEVFDVRQGFGPPCTAAPGGVPDGCFFFVYATAATRGWVHRVHSDAPFRADVVVGTDGNECGTASVHHSGRETCHWYLGPVDGRTDGQRECVWLTTVEGSRESEPSNRVCLTWEARTP